MICRSIATIRPHDAILQSPAASTKLRRAVAETAWFKDWLRGFIVRQANQYLTATLDIAKPGDMILMVSYGSGSGSDAFVWKVTDRINEARDLAVKTATLLDENITFVDYGTYAKYRGKIIRNK